MDENKRNEGSIFRVFKAYKNSMLIGFLIGVCLVIGVTVVGQVVGKESRPMATSVTEEVNLKDRSIKNPEQAGIEYNESIELIEKSSEEAIEESLKNTEVFIPTFGKKHFTVLLVGVDQRVGEKSVSNTDTLLVASINVDDGKVALISIPRDTQVVIPGYGIEKINAAARLGNGLRTTKDLVEELTGLTIDGHVRTNFEGFKTIIDTLGGITITVEKDMYYVTGDEKDGIIALNKGQQRLNGTKALQYARFRQDALGDITRATRQQAVLKAMVKEFLQMKTVPKLPGLVTQMVKLVETDLTVGQMWSLANVILRYDRVDIISQTLPGNFLIENDISYWNINPLKAKVVVKRLLEEGKTTSVFFNDGAREGGT